MTTSSAEPIDLHYPSTYHRHKSAIMVYSAILVVLAFAVIGDTIKVGPADVSLELSTDLLRLFLWIAATYYAIGFYFDVRATYWLNSERLARRGAASLDESLGLAGKEISAFVNFLLNTKNQLDQHVQKLDSLVQRFASGTIRNMESESRQAKISNRILIALTDYPLDLNKKQAVSALLNTFRTLMSEERLEYMQDVRDEISDLRNSSKGLIDAVQRSGKDISNLKSGFDTFTARLGIHRIRSFKWLDVMGTLSAYCLGTAAALYYLCPYVLRAAQYISQQA